MLTFVYSSVKLKTKKKNEILKAIHLKLALRIYLKIIDFSVGCSVNRCTESRVMNVFTASKCK